VNTEYTALPSFNALPWLIPSENRESAGELRSLQLGLWFDHAQGHGPTYIAVLLTAWCVISIPAAVLIGTAIAVGTEQPPEAREVKQAA
jgi:hypothetical protein